MGWGWSRCGCEGGRGECRTFVSVWFLSSDRCARALSEYISISNPLSWGGGERGKGVLTEGGEGGQDVTLTLSLFQLEVSVGGKRAGQYRTAVQQSCRRAEGGGRREGGRKGEGRCVCAGIHTLYLPILQHEL